MCARRFDWIGESSRGGNNNLSSSWVPARFVFVCSGNTCRSVMAAAVARDFCQRNGFDPTANVTSGGLYYGDFEPVLHTTTHVLESNGISHHMEEHLSHELTGDDLQRWHELYGEDTSSSSAGLILCMTEQHKATVLERGSQCSETFRDRVHVLGGQRSIPDPYMQQQHVYDNTFELIKQEVERLMPQALGLQRSRA